MITIDQLTSLKEELARVQAELAKPEVYTSARAKTYALAQNELTAKIELFEHYLALKDQLAQAERLTSDAEMGELARMEIEQLTEAIATTEARIKVALVPADPSDAKNAIIEIRAGAGGDESSLFAGELARLYAHYGEQHDVHLEIASESPNEVGGYKEVIFEAIGPNAYKLFKYESGVHRVQRVPATESAGRIHTSTVTVAVLPEAEEEDLIIDPKDLRIDVYRSSGHGGQSVNTTDSAVRITHLPTGIVVTCQDEKSQLKNKTKAMNVLRSRLLAIKADDERKAAGEARLSQIGTGDRSEKIRTYNFPQDRVTDHRIGYTTRNITRFMDGEIDELVSELAEADIAARMKLEHEGY